MQYIHLLFRQVHPHHVTPTHDGHSLSSTAFEIDSPAFTPNSRDEGKLSVDCSNLTTPEESYKLFTGSKKIKGEQVLHLESKGVWAVSRKTCDSESLPVYADPVPGCDLLLENKAHHLIDFKHHPSKREIKIIAKKLRDEAQARGRLWPIDEEK